MPRMHKAFGVSSLLLFLSFLWMLGADYYREWRKYQADFTKLDVKKTAADMDAALAQLDESKRKEVESALADAEAALVKQRNDLRELEREQSRKDAVRYRIDQNFRFS